MPGVKREIGMMGMRGGGIMVVRSEGILQREVRLDRRCDKGVGKSLDEADVRVLITAEGNLRRGAVQVVTRMRIYLQ